MLFLHETTHSSVITYCKYNRLITQKQLMAAGFQVRSIGLLAITLSRSSFEDK